MKFTLTVFMFSTVLFISYGGTLNEAIGLAAPAEERIYSNESLTFVTLGLFGEKKYLFANMRANWYDAMDFCKSYGMDLVKIDDDQENNLIQNHLAETGDIDNNWYWIGAHKIGRTTFAWMDGESILFSDFDVNEPNELHLQHCLCVFKGKWKNNYCYVYVDGNNEFGTAFICEERTV